VQFNQSNKVKEIQMMFQGGFVAKQCDLCIKENGSWRPVHTFHPTDSNALQTFPVPSACPESAEWGIYFRQPTDFYGRITLYRLNFFN